MIDLLRHNPDGEIYAMQTEGDEVTGICGPLHHTELGSDVYNWEPEDLDWARAELDAGRFALV